MILRLAQVRGESAYVPLGQRGVYRCPTCGRTFEYRYCGRDGSF